MVDTSTVRTSHAASSRATRLHLLLARCRRWVSPDWGSMAARPTSPPAPQRWARSGQRWWPRPSSTSSRSWRPRPSRRPWEIASPDDDPRPPASRPPRPACAPTWAIWRATRTCRGHRPGPAVRRGRPARGPPALRRPRRARAPRRSRSSASGTPSPSSASTGATPTWPPCCSAGWTPRRCWCSTSPTGAPGCRRRAAGHPGVDRPRVGRRDQPLDELGLINGDGTVTRPAGRSARRSSCAPTKEVDPFWSLLGCTQELLPAARDRPTVRTHGDQQGRRSAVRRGHERQRPTLLLAGSQEAAGPAVAAVAVGELAVAEHDGPVDDGGGDGVVVAADQARAGRRTPARAPRRRRRRGSSSAVGVDDHDVGPVAHPQDAGVEAEPVRRSRR